MTNLPEQLQHHLAQIENEQLRAAITNEFEQLNKRFGLVFERHMPEGVRLPGHRISRGTKVAITHKAGKPVKDPNFYTVASRVTKDAETVTLADSAGNTFEHPLSEIVAAKEFGDITYPGLKVLKEIHRDDRPDAPTHTIINGENHHVLEALQWTHSGKVDLIYIDPPYNTGNADWKYNDRYVDSNDGYRHSKWLSFMEKRLLLAKKLLKPTGVVVMAIDDNEHHRLRLLGDQVFGEGNFLVNLTWQGGIKSNARFTGSGADYMIVFAKDREELIDAGVSWSEAKGGIDEIQAAAMTFWKEHQDDTKAASAALRAWFRSLPAGHPAVGSKHYNRVDGHGGRPGAAFFAADLAAPEDRPNRSREVLIHPETGRPCLVPKSGWNCSTATLRQRVSEGRVYFGDSENRIPNSKKYIDEVSTSTPSPTFVSDRRSGTKSLESVLGDKRFPFPKDANVLMRWFRMIAPQDAVVLDFFGGSGTTAESVMRLNAEDGGTRQCILVTNNELAKADDTKLRKAGYQPGDAEYEALGVFHHVTKPRLETVATGIREDGSKYSDGLEANLAFLEFKYLEEVDILQGKSINDLSGLFWLKAGGRGTVPVVTAEDERRGYALSDGMAILLSTGAARELKSEVSTRGINLDALFIVTDSDAQGDEAAALFAGTPAIERIYGPYLEAFQVNKNG